MKTMSRITCLIVASALALCAPAARAQAPAGSPAEGLGWLMEPGEPAADRSRSLPLPVVAGSLYLLGALVPRLDPPAPGPPAG